MSTEYPAMIYKTGRSNAFIANCIVKNLVGFGKTEEAALNNLKESFKNVTQDDVTIVPMYGFPMAQNG